MAKIIITAEGKLEKERRLNELVNEIMPEVRARIKFAREQGDLSENAEYHAAREEYAKLEAECDEIREILKDCEIVTNANKDVVQVGTKLTYLDIDENETYSMMIVGTAEADLANNKISNESPIGQALLNHKAGETVVVKTPKGTEYQIKILEING